MLFLASKTSAEKCSSIDLSISRIFIIINYKKTSFHKKSKRMKVLIFIKVLLMSKFHLMLLWLSEVPEGYLGEADSLSFRCKEAVLAEEPYTVSY